MAQPPAKPRRQAPKPLADLIGGAIDPLLAKQGFGESDIIMNWDDIVGERLAAVTEPLKLQWPVRGPKRAPDMPVEPATLVVKVEGAFAIEVQHMADLLCQRINGRLGWRCVGRIALRQGPVERPAPKRPIPPPPAQAIEKAKGLAQGIDDDALREALTRLGARVLSQKRAK
jgi:hypothetical protein